MNLSLTGLALLFAAVPVALAATGATASPHVTLETSKGKIVLELYPDKAPKSVANFLEYVKAGAYDGTVFHRIIAGFMIQGGGMDASGKMRPTRAPINNEADNGLKNLRGTLAMARTNDPHSATNQFFINTVDNTFLNFKDKSVPGWGYTVLGKVIEGMDVVDAIAAVPVKNPAEGNPVEPVLIKKATVNK